MPFFPLVDETQTTVLLSARWIAPSGEKWDNYTFLTRKSFFLDRVPAHATVRVSADSRYVLYLNGNRVGAGPVRGTHKRTFFDSYNVVAGLREGENHLATEVHCPVKPVTMAAPPIAPALFVQLEELVETDSSWQARPDPAHRPDALFYTHHIGFSDYRDLRLQLVGWQVFADRAEGWGDAVDIAGAHELGGRPLVPRDITALTEDCYRPARVVLCGSVPPHVPAIETNLDYAELMQEEEHLVPATPRFQNAKSLTWGGPALVLPEDSGQGACVILDFNRELCGNFVMEVEAPAGTIVDVGYDEAVAEGRINPRQINPNRAVYRYADRYILRDGPQRIENRLQERGLRVMQLVFRRFSKPVRIQSLQVTNRIYRSPIRATFECDQPFLNRLWEMARHTLSTCCLDLFVDCPWREQTLWIDDQPFESLYYLELTCHPVFAARNLRVGADGVQPDGLIPARYPSAYPMYFRSMPSLWTIVLSDYYLYTGDLRLVQELLHVMDKALSVYDRWRDSDGLVPYQEGDWNFTDWGYDLKGVFMGGKAAVLNLLIAAAFKRAAELHHAVGDEEGEREFHIRSRQTAEAVNNMFWLDSEGHYFDCTEPADGRHTFSQIPHALALHSALLKPSQVQQALSSILSPEAIRAEYGFQVYVLRALAEHGLAGQAMHLLRELWGHVVWSDSPALWEVSTGRKALINGFMTAGSLCHGYSCAPIDFLQRYLLGIRPLEPGFATFTLKPQPLGVLWAKGEVPTPHGCIAIEWYADDEGTLLASVEIPQGTAAVLTDGSRIEAGSHRLEISPDKTRLN
ncbi:MAG: family 78 glycoside hydrolase catalytic domain [Armatimonadetes bacterium]|nr:family 78 glycoside hydrolase catalytic domain [Armatimonadota bacterium]